jgi:pilus assembly protein Flp/PilA
MTKVKKLINRGNPKPHEKNQYITGEKRMERIKNFFKDESGASAVEYGLLVALIAVVIIGAVTALGTNLSAKFQVVSDSVAGAGTGGGGS